ncbi:SDR family NAD(P)-dependent oxidoreductase [Clostridium akagii]|uniref:SDR family NAD(P)-dependent oxidoreductase n=1 Tax=Clostridium akagii TaxID=91623 RepID=UPI00047B81F0|nr:SDR family oxidoreductase [Clostridium akagii]
MGKTVLITGASSGLGYEFVKLFSKDNYHLILVARNLKRLEEIKIEFPSTKITIISKDLTAPNAVKELYEKIKAQKFNVDVLVNNAGFGLLGEFDKLDLKRQLNMIQLNISVLTELTHYVLQEMKSRKDGKIMNVASVASFEPGPLMAVYYATKAYVLSFSEALVEELKGSGITITTLCPGPTSTNFGKVASADKSKMFSRAMAADVATKIGYHALMKNKRVVIPGASNKAMVYLVKFMPRSLVTKVVKYISQQ